VHGLPIACYHLYQLMLWNVTMDTLLLDAMGADIEIIVITDAAMVV
jgi:hypothetical protein